MERSQGRFKEDVWVVHLWSGKLLEFEMDLFVFYGLLALLMPYLWIRAETFWSSSF